VVAWLSGMVGTGETCTLLWQMASSRWEVSRWVGLPLPTCFSPCHGTLHGEILFIQQGVYFLTANNRILELGFQVLEPRGWALGLIAVWCLGSESRVPGFPHGLGERPWRKLGLPPSLLSTSLCWPLTLGSFLFSFLRPVLSLILKNTTAMKSSYNKNIITEVIRFFFHPSPIQRPYLLIIKYLETVQNPQKISLHLPIILLPRDNPAYILLNV